MRNFLCKRGPGIFPSLSFCLSQVYLEGGFAYVPVQRVVTIVVARYRMGISKSLVEASNHFAFVASDSRFGPLLQVRCF